MKQELKFAVLIDADNISVKYIKFILDEIANYGIATYKRVYGDWTSSNLNSWKKVLLDNSITPIHQYSYTSGKSSTDSAMIIDAMDILYSDNVDGFCIVSSDSDFTRLAARLREAGMTVIGMGESKTPAPFIAACNQFKYLDILASDAEVEEKIVIKPEEEESKPQTNLEVIKHTIISLIEEGSDEEGWIFSGVLGNQLLKRYPDFDTRNFGYPKFTSFIKSFKIFETKITKSDSDSNIKLVYIRLKNN